MDTPIEPHAFTNLGAIKRTPDPRDHLVGGVGVYNFPDSIMNEAAFAAPILYQGQRPACGAHAGTFMKALLGRTDGSNPTEYDTPRYLWANMKRDGSSPSEGVTMDNIFKTLQKYGADTFEPLENNVTYDDIDYANIKFITVPMVTAGQKNLIASYAYPQDISFNGIKQTIANFGHALLLIEVNDRFWTAANGVTSWAEKDILPLAPPSSAFPVISAHFILAHSYDANRIYFANSFGTGWGMTAHPGHGYFGPEYVPQVVEIGIAHNPPVPVVVAPTTTPSAIQTVQTALPQVQTAINNLKNLPPAQKTESIGIIQEILEKAEELLTGHLNS